MFALASGSRRFRRSWGHLELLPPDRDNGNERSWLYLSVPKPSQTVQRAELWGVMAALQASRPVHLGVDNANEFMAYFRMPAYSFDGRSLASRRMQNDLQRGGC